LRRSKEVSGRVDQTGIMENSAPTAEMMVDQVMSRWPPTIRVFIDFRMGCVGCPIAAFHSIRDAGCEHKVDTIALLQALRASIER
jgi:hybrid cluster-associated redox disulfide protein